MEGFLKLLNIVCTPPPFLLGERGGVNLLPNFPKVGGEGGVDRTSIFRGRVAGKEGVTFFSGVAIFTLKINKLKFKIFNDKKCL